MDKQEIIIDLDDYEVTYNIYEQLHMVFGYILCQNQGKVKITIEELSSPPQNEEK